MRVVSVNERPANIAREKDLMLAPFRHRPSSWKCDTCITKSLFQLRSLHVLAPPLHKTLRLKVWGDDSEAIFLKYDPDKAYWANNLSLLWQTVNLTAGER